MKPLIILLATFIISILTFHFINGQYDFELSGRIAMAVMSVFTGIDARFYPVLRIASGTNHGQERVELTNSCLWVETGIGRSSFFSNKYDLQFQRNFRIGISG